MQVVIPFSRVDPKTRLSDLLNFSERKAVADAMLQDVLIAVQKSEHDPLVVTPSPIPHDVSTVVDDRSLSDAVNDILDRSQLPVAVIMADVPLVTVSHFAELTKAPGDVVLAPSHDGGTNALVVRDSDFTVDYHGDSYLQHRTIAEDRGLDITEAGSWRLMIDIDRPSDLAYILRHGDGHAFEWLANHGFTLTANFGPTVVRRDQNTGAEVPRE